MAPYRAIQQLPGGSFHTKAPMSTMAGPHADQVYFQPWVALGMHQPDTSGVSRTPIIRNTPKTFLVPVTEKALLERLVLSDMSHKVEDTRGMCKSGSPSWCPLSLGGHIPSQMDVFPVGTVLGLRDKNILHPCVHVGPIDSHTRTILCHLFQRACLSKVAHSLPSTRDRLTSQKPSYL